MRGERGGARQESHGGSLALRQTAASVCVALSGVMLACSAAPAAQPPAAPAQSPAIRMLVVKTEADARDAVALHSTGMPFDRIVRERSIGPERQRGGYVGRVAVGSLSPAAREAVLKTTPGRLTPVFPTEGGFGVIQVLTDREAQEEEARLRRDPEALEMLKQGTEQFENPWILLSVFTSLVTVLILVTFVGEAVREAFDPKKFTVYK